MLYAVIDTNVLFEGLTKSDGACGLIVDAWLNGIFVACVSNALALEYTLVLKFITRGVHNHQTRATIA